MEIFRDIKEYEGHYQISNLGNVKSVKFGKVLMLKTIKSGKGYLKVFLWKNGIRKKQSVHRLVALVFISNTYNKPEINHKDGIKTNNCFDNLEWVTPSENMLHAYKNRLRKIQKGSEIFNAKLNENQVKSIKISLSKGGLLKNLAKEFNVCIATISRIKTNKIWLHV